VGCTPEKIRFCIQRAYRGPSSTPFLGLQGTNPGGTHSDPNHGLDKTVVLTFSGEWGILAGNADHIHHDHYELAHTSHTCVLENPSFVGGFSPRGDTMNRTVEIYDTTLRDGTQQEGISLTVRDKLKICSLLDGLGVSYIEGGWPGANPKEDEFFERGAGTHRTQTRHGQACRLRGDQKGRYHTSG